MDGQGIIIFSCGMYETDYVPVPLRQAWPSSFWDQCPLNLQLQTHIWIVRETALMYWARNEFQQLFIKQFSL